MARSTCISPLAWMRVTLVAIALCMADVAAQPGARQPGDYPLTADSRVQAGVPHGRLEGPFEFHSRVFAGTVRRYWIYVPVQYDGRQPASLLVFQDGQRATNPQGSLRVQNVLDNLIHRGEIPVTIGLFITPGNRSAHYPDDLGMSNPDHRAEEYDALDDRYARILVEEMLPLLGARFRLADDPAQRAIGGTSSGAICAFTVAWHRPDVFGKVISMIGSYTSIGYRPAQDGKPLVPGGDLYPGLVRKSPIRPLRIFLQDGANDLDNEHGHWFLANQQMLAALHWANVHADSEGDRGPRYDVAHAWGDGGHSDAHGGALLPDILRWLWRDGPTAVEPPAG
ncbi:alpha/beta hydrolase-fold protein [Pseudoxanthomonas daejeonensis]|uniref:alpha/beta hydrolase n=1 Tax=Pseudoxanthomonas daejeonensis TaxID=266062 RepID=UPI001F546A21|nr:alpha/beta hydrolase-fold protein [Pseudoxanthomonas daejeonensis]UNK56287.1 alpha/beta hydrolase-fold protein [Pseudoxanthomonas daejeonensis]